MENNTLTYTSRRKKNYALTSLFKTIFLYYLRYEDTKVHVQHTNTGKTIGEKQSKL